MTQAPQNPVSWSAAGTVKFPRSISSRGSSAEPQAPGPERRVWSALKWWKRMAGWWLSHQPLWKMMDFVSWDDYSQYMESHKIHVPNHQPDGEKPSKMLKQAGI